LFALARFLHQRAQKETTHGDSIDSAEVDTTAIWLCEGSPNTLSVSAADGSAELALSRGVSEIEAASEIDSEDRAGEAVGERAEASVTLGEGVTGSSALDEVASSEMLMILMAEDEAPPKRFSSVDRVSAREGAAVGTVSSTEEVTVTTTTLGVRVTTVGDSKVRVVGSAMMAVCLGLMTRIGATVDSSTPVQ
jgi:hypothetical protein